MKSTSDQQGAVSPVSSSQIPRWAYPLMLGGAVVLVWSLLWGYPRFKRSMGGYTAQFPAVVEAEGRDLQMRTLLGKYARELSLDGVPAEEIRKEVDSLLVLLDKDHVGSVNVDDLEALLGSEVSGRAALHSNLHNRHAGTDAKKRLKEILGLVNQYKYNALKAGQKVKKETLASEAVTEGINSASQYGQ